MPQRFVNVFVATAGLAAVLVLMLVGLDARRSAAGGPRWKRRLVTAGFMLMAMIGLPLRSRDADAAPPTPKAKPAKPPRIMCYKPAPMPRAPQTVARLRQRLPMLEKYLKAEKLDAKVVAATLQNVERDLTVLDNKWELGRLSEKDRAEAVELRDALRAQVKQVRARLNAPDPELTRSRDWKKITEAWAAAVPLATSGKSTTRQRKAVDKQLASAIDAAKQLAGRGMISHAEAGLLESESARLKAEIHKDPPTDCKVMCYDMAYLPPAQASVQRMTKRLPLLKKLAASGKVNAPALRKVLPSVETDLKTLTSEKEIARLGAGERERAKKLAADAQAVVAQIKELLGETK